MRLYIVLLFTLALSLHSAAQEKPVVARKSYTTRPLNDTAPPVIDGILDDQGWDLVEWTGDYVENEPDENTAPTEQTKFKVLYDKRFIYFAFRCLRAFIQIISKRDAKHRHHLSRTCRSGSQAHRG